VRKSDGDAPSNQRKSATRAPAAPRARKESRLDIEALLLVGVEVEVARAATTLVGR